MRKNKDDSWGGRREPYNQPIKIYVEPIPDRRRLYDEVDIGLSVAREVVRAREAAKMTQAELARALKTKRQTISSIEVDAKHVTIKMLGRIARALKCVLQIRIVAVRGGRSYGAMSKEGPQ